MVVLAGGEAETKGYLEFDQDPSDRNGLVSDLFIYASDSTGEVNTNAGSKKTADGGVYRGKVQLKLLTSTSGLLLYTSEDEVPYQAYISGSQCDTHMCQSCGRKSHRVCTDTE